MSNRRTTTRRRGQGGNAMLEMAMIMGPMLVLVFATIDMSVYACWRLALTSASQDAVRNIITQTPRYNGTTYSSLTAMAKAMMINRSLGFINSTNVDSRVQVRYFAPNDMVNPLNQGQLPKTIPASGGLPARLITNMNQAGNIVQLDVVSIPWNWIIRFAKIPGYNNTLTHSSLNISLTSADVLQNLPVGTFVYPNP